MTIAHIDVDDESINIVERTPLEKFKFVYDALRAHKKIKFKHKRNFLSDGKMSSIVCIFTNPQFNRTFAILEDRAVVDYKFEITDFVYNDFEIYDDAEEDFKEMTIEEIQLQLGYKIKIVG